MMMIFFVLCFTLFSLQNLTVMVANRTLVSMGPAETVFLVTTVSATLDTLESTVKVGSSVLCINILGRLFLNLKFICTYSKF